MSHNFHAFRADRSDQSSCANQRRKGIANSETITAVKAAAFAEQGTHVALEKGLLEERCQPEEGRAQGPDRRQED